MGNIWIGTWYGGLARFDGTNWTVYNTSNSGLPDIYAKSIAIDTFGNIWIGTNSRGLAVFKEGGVVEVKDIKNSVLKTGYKIVLLQSYPITRISYSILKRSHIVLKVFDIKGRILSTLVNDLKEKGEYKIKFNTNNISNGTYFINLRAGNNSVTKKMVVLK